MKSIFIYNPNSGNGKILKYLTYIKKELESVYDVVDIYESKSAQDIEDTVKKASEIYDRIIFAGGDGTFNNVACGISSCDKRPPLGYIPVGTACDIAGNLGISKNVKKALKVIKEDYFVKHDVGMINDRYFMYVVCIGACTGTSYTTRQEAKKILGKFAYIKDGIDEFLNTPLKRVKIKCENGTVETTVPLLLIMNTYSVGGIPFNRNCKLNDGKFDIVLINNGTGKGRWNIISYFIRGLLRLKKTTNAISLEGNKIDVEVEDDLIWCVDGERGPKGHVSIKNLHNHLTIIAPSPKKKK